LDALGPTAAAPRIALVSTTTELQAWARPEQQRLGSSGTFYVWQQQHDFHRCILSGRQLSATFGQAAHAPSRDPSNSISSNLAALSASSRCNSISSNLAALSASSRRPCCFAANNQFSTPVMVIFNGYLQQHEWSSSFQLSTLSLYATGR
jgi:hypothetical protein